MEEPGVSRTMSVVLGGTTDRKEAVKSLPALMAARHRGAGRRPALSTTGHPDNGGNGGGVVTPDLPGSPGSLPA
jgi:hypothetical protein